MSNACLTADKNPTVRPADDKAWMQAPRLLSRSLNDNQRTSLSAMIAYVSHESGQSEFRIENQLSNHFNIPNSQYLPEKDFDDAIRFLTDVIM